MISNCQVDILCLETSSLAPEDFVYNFEIILVIYITSEIQEVIFHRPIEIQVLRS